MLGVMAADENASADDPEPAVLLRHLRELIAALDHRVPHLERVGESDIVRDAVALREKAMKRIRELDRGE
jgi:hypothetical protein